MKEELIDFIDFDTIKPPIEKPMWVKQEDGRVQIGCIHNNGMGCSGIAVCTANFKDNTIAVSNNEFLIKVTHWAVLGSREQIMEVLEVREN